MYRKLVMQMMVGKNPNPGSDFSWLAAQTLHDVINLTLSARKA